MSRKFFSEYIPADKNMICEFEKLWLKYDGVAGIVKKGLFKELGSSVMYRLTALKKRKKMSLCKTKEEDNSRPHKKFNPEENFPFKTEENLNFSFIPVTRNPLSILSF